MTMSRDKSNFAVLILSHGRPNNVMTLGSLERSGYTGRWYIIIDNEDAAAEEYRAKYGDHVVQFDKAAAAQTFDTADTQQDRRTDAYARNASFGIARDLGLDYFLQLDDDYQFFGYRWDRAVRTLPQIRDLDAVNAAMLDLLEDTGAATVAMSQGGDYIGGAAGKLRAGIKRKAMNSFYLRVDRPVTFLGRINDDVNTYVVHGGRGALFLTVMALQLVQRNTQKSDGGMTDIYQSSGTYVKSFYTVMMAPSCVSVRTMGRTDRRYHHHIKWDHAVPKILNDRHRKA
jgi:hypothetical protein